MPRIILEDIKIKKIKKKEELSIKKDSIIVGSNTQKIEESKKQSQKKSKIDEYFRNLSGDKKNTQNQRLYTTPQIKRKRKIVSKLTIISFVIVCFLGLIFWIGYILQKTNIEITAKVQTISYNGKKFLASKNPNINAVDFEIMINNDKKKKKIILTESKEVSIKAKGIITLYNEFSTTPQKIIAGSFLSGPEGKSYKTNSTVTIPGYKLVDKKNVPGQINVEISSFLPGELYNLEDGHFYIDSFKGTNKYQKIYGKIKTSINGGAVGLIYTLNDSDRADINNIAETSFKEDMFKKVNALVPDGYILYPNAFTFSYNIDENFFSQTPETEIEINGELSAILLNKKSLIDNMLKISLPEIKKEELKSITIFDFNNLSFEFFNKDQIIDKSINEIYFVLSGKINALWQPDVFNLKNQLKGIHKNDVLSIFRQDPGIAGAIVKIFPPWQSYIPNDILKINIKLK